MTRRLVLPGRIAGLMCLGLASTGQGATNAPVISAPPPPVAASLEARVTKLEQLLESQTLVEMLMRLERLQADVQRLHGDAEVQGHDIESLKRRQRDLSQDIDRRLRQIEQAAAAAAAKEAPPAQTPQPPVVAPPAASSAPPDAAAKLDVSREQVMYQRALDGLKASRYDQAIGDFQIFLASYPKSEYAANAQYWLGEANYVTRRYDAAAIHFKKAIDNYPASTKLADAMLKLGFAYYELGDREQARKTLNDVVVRYPGATAARLATERLQKMKSEGR